MRYGGVMRSRPAERFAGSRQNGLDSHAGNDRVIVQPDKPLTLAAYAAGPEIVAYIEPVAVGDVLPDRPVFLPPTTM